MTHLAIDIGSRFADLAFTDGKAIQVLKFAVADRSEGAAALGAIDAAVHQFGFSVNTLESVRIGSTGALNAVLQRKGARVALLATDGFTDTFFLARQNRQDLYDPSAASPTPSFLLNEADVYSVPGRIDASGRETNPLCHDALIHFADQIAEEKFDAVAICLIFAHLNPAHELACLEVLSKRCPNLHISLSHRVDPQPREYERTVSTCLDAWLKPRFSQSATEITEALAQRGFRGQLLFGDGRGALMSSHTAQQFPAKAFASGPAAATQLAATLTAEGPERPRLIMDIGSISCDLSFAPASGTAPLVANAVYGGVPIRREIVDLNSFSLGARHAAVLRTNQRLEFELPDAPDPPSLELALRARGRVDPITNAREMEPLVRLAEQAGWADAMDAAQQIISSAALKIAAEIVHFAVRRNINPANAQLVAMGGLGPLLAADIANILSIREVLMPHAPAAAGALGLLSATARFEAAETLGGTVAEVTPESLTQLYATLMEDITNQATTLSQIKLAPPTAVITIAATPQMHPMQIEITPPPETSAEIRNAFCAAYRSRYGITPPGAGHIFSILLRRDAVNTQAPTATDLVAPIDVATTERFETSAGTIHVPADWSISQSAGGYVLQAKGHSK